MKTLKNSLLSLVFISLSLFGLAAGAGSYTNESGCPCSGLSLDGRTWAQAGGRRADEGHTYGIELEEGFIVIHDHKDSPTPVVMQVRKDASECGINHPFTPIPTGGESRFLNTDAEMEACIAELERSLTK